MTAQEPGPPRDPWEVGEAYDDFMGRWSRLVAPEFLRWLGIAAGARWLEIGTGTGALLQAIATHAAPSHLTGLDSSEGFLEVAAQRLPAHADLRVGDALHLPFETGAFDAVVSGLVLNFLPQPEKALAEMRRACRDGGVVAAYVWDYAEGMQYLRIFWDVATELDPEAIPLHEGRTRFPLCRPEPLAALLTDGGLSEVETSAIVVARRFGSFAEYWEPFLAGQGPAGGYVAALDDERRAALAGALQRRLPLASDGSIQLSARAWAVRGRN